MGSSLSDLRRLFYGGGTDAEIAFLTAAAAAGQTAVTMLGATSGDRTFAEGDDLIFGTVTGSMLGTAVGQKVALHGAVPIAQAAGANQAAVAATAATNVTPFGFSTAAQADAIVTLVNAIRTVLVNKGIMKGAA